MTEFGSEPLLVDGTINEIVGLAHDAQSGRLYAFESDGVVLAYHGEHFESVGLDFKVGLDAVTCGVLVTAGDRLAVCGPTGIELWEVGSQRRIAHSSRTREAQVCAFSADGERLYVGGEDGLVSYALPELKPIEPIVTGERHAAITAVPGSDTIAVAVASQAGSAVHFFADRTTVVPVGSYLRSNHDEISPVAFSPSGKLLAFTDTELHVCAYPALQGLMSFERFGGRSDSVDSPLQVHQPWSNPAFLSEHQLAVSPPGTGTIWLLELGRGVIGQSLEGHAYGVTRLLWVADKGLVSAGMDAKLFLWPFA